MPSKHKSDHAAGSKEPRRAGGDVETKAAVSGFIKGRDFGEVRQSVKASVKRSAKKNAGVWEKLSKH